MKITYYYNNGKKTYWSARAGSSNFTMGIMIALQKASSAALSCYSALASRSAMNKNDIPEETQSRWRWASCLTEILRCYWQVGVGGKGSGKIDHPLNKKSTLWKVPSRTKSPAPLRLASRQQEIKTMRGESVNISHSGFDTDGNQRHLLL